MPQDKDPNEGEGNRTAARRYDAELHDFVAEGKVPEAATQARRYVERDPAGAAKAERAARGGPRRRSRVSIDDLVAKGQTVIDRAVRAIENLRARLGRR